MFWFIVILFFGNVMLEVMSITNGTGSDVSVRLRDFMPLNNDIMNVLSNANTTVINSQQNQLDLSDQFRKIYNDKVFLVNVILCDQLETYLRGTADQTSLNAFYEEGEKLTRQLLECRSGWSIFSSFVVERCLMNPSRNESCLSDKMDHLKEQIIKTKISTLITMEYFTRSCPDSDDVSKVEANVERFLDDYAQSLVEVDIGSHIKEQLSSLECNRVVVRQVPSRVQKRYLIPALLPIAELTFYVFYQTVFVALYYFSITSVLKWKFKFQSNKNQHIANDLNSSDDPLCRDHYYWGSCGIPGTHFARECPDGGQLVFEESCSKLVGYLPGSMMCKKNGKLDKRAELPIVDDDADVEQKYETSRERRQNFRYHAMGISRFMCRSLCVKLNDGNDVQKCVETIRNKKQ